MQFDLNYRMCLCVQKILKMYLCVHGSGRRQLWSSATWRSTLKAAAAPLGGILDGGDGGEGLRDGGDDGEGPRDGGDGGERLRDGGDWRWRRWRRFGFAMAAMEAIWRRLARASGPFCSNFFSATDVGSPIGFFSSDFSPDGRGSLDRPSSTGFFFVP